MITPTATPPYVESPVIFPAGGEDLFGVLTQPAGIAVRDPAIVLTTGGAYIPSPNRNRLSVHLARRLAGQGFPVFRFDYHGVGESSGAIKTYHLDRPFVQDLEGATRRLAAMGLRRFVLIGSCFGARTVLGAAQRLRGLAGAVLISTPVRDFQMGDRIPTRMAEEMGLPQMIRRAAHPQVLRDFLAPADREAYLRSRRFYSIVKRILYLKVRRALRRSRPRAAAGEGDTEGRISAQFADGFLGLVKRRVPVLLLYGTEEDFYREFLGAAERAGPLREALATADGAVALETIAGVVHGFTTVDVQEAVLTRVQAWVQRHWSPEASHGIG